MQGEPSPCLGRLSSRRLAQPSPCRGGQQGNGRLTITTCGNSETRRVGFAHLDPSMFSAIPGGLGCVILGRVGADWIPQATPYQSSPHRGFALPGRKEREDMVVWGRDSSPDCSSPEKTPHIS